MSGSNTKKRLGFITESIQIVKLKVGRKIDIGGCFTNTTAELILNP